MFLLGLRAIEGYSRKYIKFHALRTVSNRCSATSLHEHIALRHRLLSQREALTCHYINTMLIAMTTSRLSPTPTTLCQILGFYFSAAYCFVL